jgi:hypothetical protein
MANPFKSHPRVQNTDGRSPTTTHQGGASKKEGNTSIGVTKKGSLGPNPDEGVIEKMINRNASAFRKDIVARSNRKKQPRHNGSCD